MSGYKRSSQHFNEGSGDDEAKATFRSVGAGPIASTGPTVRCRTCRFSPVLGRHCSGSLKRGYCCRHRRCALSVKPMVSSGGRHATIPPVPFFQAPVSPLPVVRRAGGDRTSSRAWARHPLSRAPLRPGPSTISREVRRNTATCSGGFAYRATTAQWYSERSRRRWYGALP